MSHTREQLRRANRNRILGCIVWCIFFAVALFADSWAGVLP